MTKVILNIHHWVSLPSEVRSRIRNLFRIPCSSSTVVSDNKLETDGTTPKDFEELTLEKMQKFTKDNSVDFYKLFDLTVSKVKEDIENNRNTEYPVEEIINANQTTNVKANKKNTKV